MGSACFKAQEGEDDGGKSEQRKSREEQRQQAQVESGQSQQQQQQQQQQQKQQGVRAEKQQQELDGQRQPSDGAVHADQGSGKAQLPEQQQGSAVAADGGKDQSNGDPAEPGAAATRPPSQAPPQLDPAAESPAAAPGSSISNNCSNDARDKAAVPAFRRMTLEELMAATNNFSERNVVSEGGRQALNVVYRGVLGIEGLQVALKRFQKKEWEDATQFGSDAAAVGSIRYPGLTSLLGFCSEGDHRLLVSEFMPNCTLAQHLFHWEQRPMSWLARLAVAMNVAQTLVHLGREKGMPVYHDLNPYKVLLDKDNQPKLSCFGLIKPLKDGRYSSNLDYLPPEQLLHGRVSAESVVYSFGLILLALFSGKSIRPTQFLEMVEEKQDLSLLLDSNLLSHPPSVEFALELVPLIAECLKRDPGERPPMDSIAEFLGILDDRSRGIGNSLAVAGGGEEGAGTGASPAVAAPSPLARAAMAGDWGMLHGRLVTVSFTPPQEPSFEVWNAEVQDLVSSRQRGDKAFKNQQWEEAIALYTKFLKCDSPPIPMLFARRCLSHLQLEHWEEALQDALQAQQSKPPWPEATYLVAAALSRLGRADEAQEMVIAGGRLEHKS
ncbi:hypothetical protein CLOM_g9018 [Closterium sp. NIES-68]|nr:hypothetical protein CLOM_g9018 [Closterium sp. NIES-68]GJP66285.1 hypothetical protein CLOP_g23175 [Closterium sp. NIES-67]